MIVATVLHVCSHAVVANSDKTSLADAAVVAVFRSLDRFDYSVAVHVQTLLSLAHLASVSAFFCILCSSNTAMRCRRSTHIDVCRFRVVESHTRSVFLAYHYTFHSSIEHFVLLS
jgi:hypothetical protein